MDNWKTVFEIWDTDGTWVLEQNLWFIDYASYQLTYMETDSTVFWYVPFVVTHPDLFAWHFERANKILLSVWGPQ